MESKRQSKQLPEITDGEITLKPFILADIAEHLAGDDDEQAKWFGGKGTEEGARNWIIRNLEYWKRDIPVYNFSIRDHEGHLIGMVEANTAHNEIDGIKEGDANISYSLYPKARGKGYIDKAITLLEKFLVEKGIHRAVIRVAPTNIHSLGVPIRLGYEPKGEILTRDKDVLKIFVKKLEAETPN